MNSWFNILTDFIFWIPLLRKGSQYIYRRLNGLQYGSYNLTDEVDLARTSIEQKSEQRVVIDAGANKGEWSRALIETGARIDRLIMIEPQKGHAARLREITSRYPNVTVESAAIGANKGTMTLYSDQVGSTFASFYRRDLRHLNVEMNHSESVSVVTLDWIAQKYKFDQIAFLKLDLEGHELETLKGSTNLLSEGRILTLQFEFGGCNIDSRTYFKDFWSLLVYQHQFKIFRLLPGRRLLQVREYSEWLEHFSWQNFLACAPGICPKWRILK